MTAHDVPALDPSAEWMDKHPVAMNCTTRGTTGCSLEPTRTDLGGRPTYGGVQHSLVSAVCVHPRPDGSAGPRPASAAAAASTPYPSTPSPPLHPVKPTSASLRAVLSENSHAPVPVDACRPGPGPACLRGGSARTAARCRCTAGGRCSAYAAADSRGLCPPGRRVHRPGRGALSFLGGAPQRAVPAARPLCRLRQGAAERRQGLEAQ
ncbi:hypothetical protein D3C73_820140 [compost metagenome]